MVTCVACDQFDVTSRLDSIQSPILVLCGTNDQLTPRRFSEKLAEQIPGAALQTIEAAGHLGDARTTAPGGGLVEHLSQGHTLSPGF